MECHNCGKEIRDNERFYCWSFSVERCTGEIITVDAAEVTKIHCLECGPGKDKTADELIRETRAAIN